MSSMFFILKSNLFDNQVYNVLTENATVHEIVEIIRRKVPDLHVEFVDSRIMNQLSYNVSCEKFKSLGFEFRGNLTQGISDTIDLLKNICLKL